MSMGVEKARQEILAAGGIKGPSTADLVLQLGDAAGSYKLSIVDSATSEVASINSDGALSAVGLTLSSGLTSSGNVTVNGTLTAASSAAFSGGVTASTNVTVQGTLTASSNTTLSGAVTASTNATVQGTLTASSNTTLSGAVTASTNVTVQGTLTASSGATLSGAVTASTNLTVNGTLTAASSAAFSGGVTASTNVTVSGTLTGSSDATIAGVLTASNAFRQAVESVNTNTTATNYGVSLLAGTSAGAVTMAFPAAAGQSKVIWKTANSTAITTVTLNSGTYDGTNATATFNGVGQFLNLIAATTDRFLILNTTGAPTLST